MRMEQVKQKHNDFIPVNLTHFGLEHILQLQASDSRGRNTQMFMVGESQ